MAQSQLFCAVLTADSVSWFQLSSATSAKPISPEQIPTPDGQISLGQNELIKQDNDWLKAHFTTFYCEVPVNLHVYGVRPASTNDAQRGPVRLQPLEKAIAQAFHAVTEDLCGSSAVVVASASSSGTLISGYDCVQLKALL